MSRSRILNREPLDTHASCKATIASLQGELLGGPLKEVS